MIYLADACALIVFLGSPAADTIMPNAAPVMRTAEIAVLSITVWEISRKVAIGKLPRVWGRWPSLTELLVHEQYRSHSLTWEDAEAANALPDIHKDPVDRMLIAAAFRSNMTIITSDRIFAEYGAETIW